MKDPLIIEAAPQEDPRLAAMARQARAFVDGLRDEMRNLGQTFEAGDDDEDGKEAVYDFDMALQALRNLIIFDKGGDPTLYFRLNAHALALVLVQQEHIQHVVQVFVEEILANILDLQARTAEEPN